MSIRRIVMSTAVVAALVVAGCSSNPISIHRDYEYSSTEEFAYSTGDSVSITADTFVGAIEFDEAAVRSVQVKIIRWADREGDLDLLDVQISQVGSEIVISATNPQELDDVAVDIEITGPPEALLDLATGVGEITCTGEPGALWECDSGVGSIELWVPADVDASVELIVGVGSVDVGFSVVGEVSSNRVIGTIGTGAESEISAHVGVGSISLGSS